jgi:hypothetical protein
MKTYGGVDILFHVFLTAALVVSGPLQAPEKESLVFTGKEAGWARAPAWTKYRKTLHLMGLELQPFRRSSRTRDRI